MNKYQVSVYAESMHSATEQHSEPIYVLDARTIEEVSNFLDQKFRLMPRTITVYDRELKRTYGELEFAVYFEV